MSFREKIHWVAFLAIAGGFGFYFVTLAVHGDVEHSGALLGILLLVAAHVLGVMILATGAMWLRNRRDVMAPHDERDRLIHQKGTHCAYYLLVVGAWAVGLSAHLGHGIGFMLNLLLGVIVLAELVRIGTQLYYYRHGA